MTAPDSLPPSGGKWTDEARTARAAQLMNATEPYVQYRDMAYEALKRHIAEYEPPPVDPDLVAAKAVGDELLETLSMSEMSAYMQVLTCSLNDFAQTIALAGIRYARENPRD